MWLEFKVQVLNFPKDDWTCIKHRKNIMNRIYIGWFFEGWEKENLKGKGELGLQETEVQVIKRKRLWFKKYTK